MRASAVVEAGAVVAMALAVGLQLQMFHPFHRVAILSIGKFTISVSSGDLINGALNTELGLKTSGQQFAGILAVGAWVVGFTHHDLGTQCPVAPVGQSQGFSDFQNRRCSNPMAALDGRESGDTHWPYPECGCWALFARRQTL